MCNKCSTHCVHQRFVVRRHITWAEWATEMLNWIRVTCFVYVKCDWPLFRSVNTVNWVRCHTTASIEASIDSVVSSGNDLFDPIKRYRFDFFYQFTYNLVRLCCFVQRRRRHTKQNRSTIFLKPTMNQDKRGICTRMFRFSGWQNRLV